MCIEEEVHLHRTRTCETLTSLSENTIPLFQKSDNIPTLHEDIQSCSISKHLKLTYDNNYTLRHQAKNKV
jgi:hypothetical protein